MEDYITLSFLNDFIFCPRSIYFQRLYENYKQTLYKQTPQYRGEFAHKAIDTQSYSTRVDVLQSISVYSEQYNIMGKIDVFETRTGKLIERKREVKTIYDGYVFQVYAQCFALREMGYSVQSIIVHDLVHNKNYPISLPEDDSEMFGKFEKLIDDINHFDLENTPFVPLKSKCDHCIYHLLCDVSLC